MSQVCWNPSAERIHNANISRFIRLIRSESDPSVFDFGSLYEYSVRSPAGFWRAIWEFFEVRGRIGKTILLESEQMTENRWFPDAQLNFAENLLQRRDDHTAIIFHSESGSCRSLSYADLYRQVAATASALNAAGV